MRNEGINAKQLTKKINLKGTNIYYHLKHLEKQNLIISKKHEVPGTNLFERIYTINKIFYSNDEANLRSGFANSPEKIRDSILFQLYLTAFAVGRQIIEIRNMSNQEIMEKMDKILLPFAKLLFINNQDLNEATDILDNLIRTLEYLKKDKDQAEYERNADYGIFLGLISCL